MLIVDVKNVEKNVEELEVKYQYRLTQSVINDTEVYGIEVQRDDFKQGKLINLERNSINIISPIRGKVEEMLEKIWRYEVSPIHLVEVLGEEVDNCVFDF